MQKYKVTISEKTFWEIFAAFNFSFVLLAAQVNRKIKSGIKFSGRCDQATCTFACLLMKQRIPLCQNDGKTLGFCFC